MPKALRRVAFWMVRLLPFLVVWAVFGVLWTLRRYDKETAFLVCFPGALAVVWLWWIPFLSRHDGNGRLLRYLRLREDDVYNKQ